MVHEVLQVHQADKVLQVTMVNQDEMVKKVLPDKAQPVNRVLQVQLVHQVPEVNKVHQVIKVKMSKLMLIPLPNF
jgi:hypothetical protein